MPFYGQVRSTGRRSVISLRLVTWLSVRWCFAVAVVLTCMLPVPAGGQGSPVVSLGITVQSKELADARLMPQGAPSLKSRSCVVVSSVDADSPCVGKLSDGNAIISIDGVPTPDVAAFEKALASLKPDSEVPIKGLYLAPAPAGEQKWVPGSVVVKVPASGPRHANTGKPSESVPSPRKPNAAAEEKKDSKEQRPMAPRPEEAEGMVGLDLDLLRELLDSLPADEPFILPPAEQPLELAEQEADKLATRREVHIPGLRDLRPEIAAALCKQPAGSVLLLDGVTRITDDTAASLAEYQGKTLFLRGVKTLSPAAAKSLSRCKASIVLSGITELHPDAAAALRATKTISFPGDCRIDEATDSDVFAPAPTPAECAGLVSGYAAWAAVGWATQLALKNALTKSDDEINTASKSFVALNRPFLEGADEGVKQILLSTRNPDVKYAAEKLLALTEATRTLSEECGKILEMPAAEAAPHLRNRVLALIKPVEIAKERFVMAMYSPAFPKATWRRIVILRGLVFLRH